MMQSDPQTDVVTRMMAILDAVRAALTTAEYDKLDALTTAMAQELALLERPGQTRVARPALLRLQVRADRNAACLLAATRGMKSARRRIEEIRAARSGLVTYDLRGRRAEPGLPGQITRRV